MFSGGGFEGREGKGLKGLPVAPRADEKDTERRGYKGYEKDGMAGGGEEGERNKLRCENAAYSLPRPAPSVRRRGAIASKDESGKWAIRLVAS